MAAPEKRKTCSPRISICLAAFRGFSLLELVVAIAIMLTIAAISVPVFSNIFTDCCIKAVTWEITGMIKEARQLALEAKYYAISFDPATGKVSLLSGRGKDEEWNTGDDIVVRSFRLADKGGGLFFGHGAYGPVPGLAAAPDGITFASNTLVCNPELTGNAGTIYIRSIRGQAVAITVNSRDFAWTIRKWGRSGWGRQ
jgi:prepilin-type N-terminal cleavage/methylation domain-containing protein